MNLGTKSQLRVAVISLEPWDQVWRRNQHLATQLIKQGLVSELFFIEPPIWAMAPRHGRPMPGIRTIAPTLRLPKRLGGLAPLARQLRSLLRSVDVLWVNDPAFGVHCANWHDRIVYDVTDDWRTFDFPPRIMRRVMAAEDRLALEAATVVCSPVLQSRWRDRYGVDAHLVSNGVDLSVWERASPILLPGPAPHIGYLGTLHDQRLDVDLVLDLARDARIGTLHLVGPDALTAASRARLEGSGKVRLHGPVPAADVAGWGKAMDVLVCPHLVNDFTLSLDAIKAYEYLASGRPFVATPTSGFQHLDDAVAVRSRDVFVDSVAKAVDGSRISGDIPTWEACARQFAQILLAKTPKPVEVGGL